MNFIQTIFIKITEAVGSLFIAIGLVASPVVIPVEPAPKVIVEVPSNASVEVIKKAPKVTEEKKPVVEIPVELQNNNQTQTEVITPHIPHQTFFFFVEKEVTPSQEVPTQQMATSAKTYTVKKGEETIKSGLLISELQKYVGSLNPYLAWRKKAESASVEQLTEMLSSNGYTLIES